MLLAEIVGLKLNVKTHSGFLFFVVGKLVENGEGNGVLWFTKSKCWCFANGY